MDVVKYLKEKKRMCSKYKLCEACPMSLFNNGKEVNCQSLETSYPEEAAAIVEKWSAEHPVETRQSEFLKMFPNAAINPDGILAIQPCFIDKTFNGDGKYCEINDCVKCRKSYWLAEVE